MSDIDFTVCIPTYNAQKYVIKTIDSICAQTFKNFEIKIFDNCSTDNTIKTIKSYAQNKNNITVIENPKNIGGEGNFTRCLQGGQGRYTALFHADDTYENGILQKAYDLFLQHKNVVAIAFHAKLIDGEGNPLGERFIPPELNSQAPVELNKIELLKLSLKYGNFITCPGVIALASVYKDHIKTWDGTKYKSSADLDVWLRLTEHGNILFVPQAHMNYRVSEASFSANLFSQRTHRHDLFLVLDEYVAKNQAELVKTDLDHFLFLKFKDESLRTYNIIRNKSLEEYPAYSLFPPSALSFLFHSKFHFKYTVIGLCIFVARLFIRQPIKRFFYKLLH